MENLNLKDLSTEQRQELLQQLQAEEQQKTETRTGEINAYKHLKDKTVQTVFERLQKINSELEDSKNDLLKEFNSLLEIKNELYDVKETQLSHSWSTQDGKITVITGFNVIDRWDETVSVGITKVNEWLESKVNDSNRDYLDIIRELLKPNKDGDLKANRVLDLQNQAIKIGDKKLIEAVEIIRDAHRPDRTSTYIKAKYKNDNGDSQWLALSMSSV